MISCNLSSTVSRAKNEKVHHSRFLGNRRVLARPVSYGRCSNVSYKGPKRPEPRGSAGRAATIAATICTSAAATHYCYPAAATNYYGHPSAPPPAYNCSAAPSSARSYDWGSRERCHLVVAAVRPRRDIWYTVDSATGQEKLTPRFVV